MAAQSILSCKFHQSGYCKFGQYCKNYHNLNTCKSVKCVDKTCVFRHPKICKYFLHRGLCKFGDDCSFSHRNSLQSNSNKNIPNQQFEALEITVKEMSKKIEILENELNLLKEENPCEMFKCEVCDYVAKSATVLKAHITRKHKKENLRQSSTQDNPLILSTPPSFRDESPPHDTPLQYPMSQSSTLFSPVPPLTSPPSPSSQSSLLSPPPPTTSVQCEIPNCTFSSTKLAYWNKVKICVAYKNISICNYCMTYVPLQELRRNPPSKV